MRRLWRWLIPHIRVCLIPVTILLVPHTKGKPRKVRVPTLAVYACFVLAVVGFGCLVQLAAQAQSYYTARLKLRVQFRQMQSSLDALKNSEDEMRGLLALRPTASKAAAGPEATGDMIDMNELTKEVRRAIDSISDLKDYVRIKRDAFYATPAGLPVMGPITSFFGPRSSNDGGRRISAFHHGMDIKAVTGTPVHVTADGVVSFSGQLKGSGNIVVVEHGMGYSTAYAHGCANLVKVGQRVKRGDVIVSSGSTGRSTGPHVHYEVWKDGSQIDPLSLMTRR